MKMKKFLAALLTMSIAVTAVPMTALAADAGDIFELQDFGLWGDSWPGAYNVGWKYADDFDTDTITGLEVGILNPAGEAIVTYTASGDQLAYQKRNGYINGARQSSAPFLKSYYVFDADGEMEDDDWVITKGAAFDKWNVGSRYVIVTVGENDYLLDGNLTSHTHSYTAETVSDAALKSDDGLKVYYKSCSDTNCAAISESDDYLFCEDLQTAINNAAEGATITLGCDITLSNDAKGNTEGIIRIADGKKLTIDGDGHTITVAQTTVDSKKASAFNIEAGANVTFTDIILNGAGTAKHGLNVFQGTANVEDCVITNFTGYAVVCNGSNVTVDGLETSGNGWGGINVDTTNSSLQNSAITIEDATINEDTSVKFEHSATSEDYKVSGEIKGGSYKKVVVVGQPINVKVNGGSYAVDPAAYVENGFVSVQIGDVFVVGEPTSVTLNTTAATIYKNRTETLTATVTPANSVFNTVTWTSDNESVATVDQNGVVTGVAVGTAKITATTADGKTATCDVTVKKKSSSSSGSSSSDGSSSTKPAEKPEEKPVEQPDEKPATPTDPAEVPAAEKIVLTMNQRVSNVFGEPVVNDVAPIIREDRTMLPIRFIAEALGATVAWDDALNKVTITKGDGVIDIYINSAVAFVNGNPVDLDSPAFIENSRTYLPLRFVAENLGATVFWNAETKEVTVVPNK